MSYFSLLFTPHSFPRDCKSDSLDRTLSLGAGCCRPRHSHPDWNHSGTNQKHHICRQSFEGWVFAIYKISPKQKQNQNKNPLALKSKIKAVCSSESITVQVLFIYTEKTERESNDLVFYTHSSITVISGHYETDTDTERESARERVQEREREISLHPTAIPAEHS